MFSQTAFQSCLDHIHTVFGSFCLLLDRVGAIFRTRLGRFWIVCSLLGVSRGFSASGFGCQDDGGPAMTPGRVFVYMHTHTHTYLYRQIYFYAVAGDPKWC